MEIAYGEILIIVVTVFFAFSRPAGAKANDTSVGRRHDEATAAHVSRIGPNFLLQEGRVSFVEISLMGAGMSGRRALIEGGAVQTRRCLGNCGALAAPKSAAGIVNDANGGLLLRKIRSDKIGHKNLL
jgi:hypothetical protein